MDNNSFLYNHKSNSRFCAPNSLYVLINYRLNKYFNDDSELISLDNIARLIGFDPKYGSQMDTHLSRLSNELNKKITLKNLNYGKIIFDNYTKDELISKLTRFKALVICITYYQYFNFLKNNDFGLEYYKKAEEPTISDNIQHCITIIKNGNQIFSIDPNCPLPNGYIDIKDLDIKYSKLILKFDEKDIQALVNLRYDSLDNAIITGMEIQNEFKKNIYDYEIR